MQSNQAKNPVIRAIDLGSGYVKYTVGTAAGDVQAASFRSVVVPAGRKGTQSTIVDASGLTKRDSVFVENQGNLYEVGPDAYLAQNGAQAGNALGDDYSSSLDYRILMLGALAYIAAQEQKIDGKVTIDALVLALPVNTFTPERIAALKEGYLGDVFINDGLTVTVKDVFVKMQPQGAYVAVPSQECLAAVNEEFQRVYREDAPEVTEDYLLDMAVLIVDPGTYTTDFILFSNGRPIENASGALSVTGRHQMLCRVRDHFSTIHGKPIGDGFLPRIDEAIMSKKKSIVLAQKPTQLQTPEVRGIMKGVATQAVSAILPALRGNEGGIGLVVVAGGHPELYVEALRERFDVPVVANPLGVFAVVSGLQVIGEAIVDAA